MRHLIVLVILASSSSLAAQQNPRTRHEQTFFSASELRSWCESEARTRFVAKNIPTYQWTARYVEDGNLLVVEGKIRAHGDDAPVSCRVAKGARERDAVVEISDAP